MDNDEVLRKLSEQIRAEMARAASERESAEETRRLRIAEERRATLLNNLVERYANLAETVTGLTQQLQGRLETDALYSVIREWFEQLGDEIDLINERIRLIAELMRLVVPAAHQAQIQQIVDEPDREIARQKKLRLWHQVRQLEKLADETNDPKAIEMIDQIMNEIAQIKDVS